MAKMLSIRFDDDQETKIKDLADQLHNSEAGIVRLAVDTLWKSIESHSGLSITVDAPAAGETLAAVEG